MSSTLTAYRIFFASPGGLPEERKAFREVISKYNDDEAVQRGVHFIPVRWELTLGGIGRPQALINEDVRQCDYFVLMLWDRWGSAPGSDGKRRYSSGTEEEYHVAWESFDHQEQPMRQIIAFFKGVDARQLADPGDQLKHVLEFKKKLEREKKLLFDTFDVLDEFKDRLRAYLGQWLRGHEGGVVGKVLDPQRPPAPQTTTDLRTTDIPPETDEKLATQQKELRDAKRLADEGKLIEAEAIFAKAISRGDDPQAFNQYGHFLTRIGRLAQARVMYERILELTELPDAEKWQAIAIGNLALTYLTRGDPDQAEKMLQKSLEISEKLGLLEGMATGYGNLGLIYMTRRDLDQAEVMYRKSLEINEKLGRLEAMATNYGNLGLIYKRRDDLDQAEAMLHKSLEFHEKLGRLEGMASNYGNLGLIYQTRGELDQGEELFRKALGINEKLGRLEAMAGNYGNLGLIYKTRGEPKEARTLWTRARDLFQKIGIPHEVAKVQEYLDELP